MPDRGMGRQAKGRGWEVPLVDATSGHVISCNRRNGLPLVAPRLPSNQAVDRLCLNVPELHDIRHEPVAGEPWPFA